jgi:spore coat protein U-like protein
MKLSKVTSLLFLLLVFSYVNEAFSSCNGNKCSCTLNSTTISFGTAFNPIQNTLLDNNFSNVLSVRCTLGSNGGSSQPISYTISFPAGTHGTIAARYMQSATPHTLNFNIYTSSAYSTVLGNTGGTEITDSYTLGSGGCASPCTKTYSVYGQIPAQPTAYSDTNQYTDAIIMTLTY